MAYVKILYQDSPSTATPLNAQNLNHMDDGIAENDRRLNELSTAGVVNTFNSRTGNVTSEKGDYDINQIVASDGQDGYIPVWRNSGTEQEPDWGFAMEEMGGSGHEILDADGTSMAQEDALQFADSFVTDDSVNSRTIVENIKEHTTKADYENATEDGIHVIDDGDDAVIGAVSDDYVEVEADGNTTYATLLNSLFSETDMAKVKDYTKLRIGILIFNLFGTTNNECYFSNSSLNSQLPATEEIRVSSNSYYNRYRQGQFSDLSSTKPTSGTKITLYYGNKKAIVDLQTTANSCWYDSENTVKQKLDLKLQGFRDTVTIPAISAGQNGSITVPFTGDLPYSVSFIANQSGKCFVASNYWTDGTNLNVSVYSAQGTSGETALINVIY